MDVTGEYPQEYDSNDPWGRGKCISLWHETMKKHIIHNRLENADGGVYITRGPGALIAENNFTNINDNETYWKHIRIDKGADVSNQFGNMFYMPRRIQPTTIPSSPQPITEYDTFFELYGIRIERRF